MSLERIIERIKESAEEEARKIHAEASREIEKIEEAVKKRFGEAEKEVARKKAFLETEISNAVLLPAKLKARGIELQSRRELIDTVFREVMRFDEADYKKVLKKLFSQIEFDESAVLHTAPGNEEVTEKFLKENSIKVTVGGSAPGIMGGFVLKAGKIEYDCTFDTLLRQLRDKLETQVGKFFEK